jgi:hypothetical protein
MKVFISFSKKDDHILHVFVDHILKLGLKLSDSEINCTGIEGSNPKTGDDFKKWIKGKIKNADVIIQLVSQNYKGSEVCLNEMGASWVLEKNVIPLLIEPIDYSNVGFIHNTTQLLKLDVYEDLLKLKDELNPLLKNKKFTISNYHKQIEIFLTEVKTVPIFDIKSKKSTYIGVTDDFSYFNKFLQKNIDFKSLLLQAQPTLNDCKLVFKETFYKDIYHFYSLQYKDLLRKQESVNDLSDYNTFDVRSATYDQLKSKNHDLPGGMNSLVRFDSIKTNVCFYSVSFRKENTELGTSFSAWVFLNNRWILFIKPWTIIDFIQSAKSNEDLLLFIKVMKRFKIFKEFNSFELHYIINQINE